MVDCIAWRFKFQGWRGPARSRVQTIGCQVRGNSLAVFSLARPSSVQPRGGTSARTCSPGTVWKCGSVEITAALRRVAIVAMTRSVSGNTAPCRSIRHASSLTSRQKSGPIQFRQKIEKSAQVGFHFRMSAAAQDFSANNAASVKPAGGCPSSQLVPGIQPLSQQRNVMGGINQDFHRVSPGFGVRGRHTRDRWHHGGLRDPIYARAPA